MEPAIVEDPTSTAPKYHVKKRKHRASKPAAEADSVGGASMKEWERANKEHPSELGRSRSCCKVCSNSQACGDSCISWSKNCRKGTGCACQG